MGWMSVGWVCCGTLPYLGFAISSLFTGVGSFLGFAGTPHFLGSGVKLGLALLPWGKYKTRNGTERNRK